MLLEPSVNKITTLLFAFDSFSLDTAFANPIPIAVPSEMIPRAAISVLTSCNILNKDAWSVVIGHCVKASPAKIVKPILSFSLSEINSEATFLAASILLGFKSSANIERETSIASIISMPKTDFLLHELGVCGRANTITRKKKKTHLNIIGK